MAKTKTSSSGGSVKENGEDMMPLIINKNGWRHLRRETKGATVIFRNITVTPEHFSLYLERLALISAGRSSAGTARVIHHASGTGVCRARARDRRRLARAAPGARARRYSSVWYVTEAQGAPLCRRPGP